MSFPRLSKAPLAILLAFSLSCRAEQLLSIDASQQARVPISGHFKMGTAVSKHGRTLAINSDYLSLDGKPWLPAMGEFHFNRSPVETWDDELRKMKAAGIDIVSTYIFWNYHETEPDKFDWSGNRDLRRFVRTADKAGLKVFLRLGPWVHGEARFGGLPDWVVNTMPVRGNDPVYLEASGRFYRQISAQIKGLQWKEGGPVLGIQLENELDHTADGVAHIAALKKLAIEAGFDLPIYSVFGTASYKYPPGEVTPTFGGYPDRPWGTEEGEIAPKGSYLFMFDSRISGEIGEQQGVLGATAKTLSREAVEKTRVPYLGAEYGGGLPQMYRRRTVLGPHDAPALHAVQLGSGANMMGYYMFHGGRNPRPAFGGIGLEESTLSGGYNDTPIVNYDFQAPLGADGQQRDALTRMRRLNQFINAFGERLAPMLPRKPDVRPANAADLATPRFAIRAQDNRAFLFVNNHVRQAPMAQFNDVRFSVKLPGQTIELPRQGMQLKPGEYFIWPINFDLDGTQLVYATAQPVTRFDAGADGIVYVFAQASGQAVEFAFAADEEAYVVAPQANRTEVDGRVVLSKLRPGTTPVLTIKRPGKRQVRVLLLDDQQSRMLTIAGFGGKPRLLLTTQQAWATPEGLALRSIGSADFRVAMYPAPDRTPRGTLSVRAPQQDGIFQVFSMHAKPYAAEVKPALLRAAQRVPPVLKGGQAKGALQPAPEVWGAAATWQLHYAPPALPKGELDDVLIETDFIGDIGRLFAGKQLVDDWYYSGDTWQFGLRGLPPALRRQALSIAVLPMRADTPVFMEKNRRPEFAGKPQLAELQNVRATPVYKTLLRP